MFCCYFLSILYQWITDELLIDKLDEYENMIELQPIVSTPSFETAVPVTAARPIAIPSLSNYNQTPSGCGRHSTVCDDNPKEVVTPSTPPTTRLRKQIQAEEEFYKEDFEIIDIDMIDIEKKD